jgi:quinol monooxygenase YgiN/ketosteroid isomerase-like protein
MENKVAAVGFAHAKLDRTDELHGVLAALAEKARGEGGFLDGAIHRDVADPGLLVFYERWESAGDVTRHLDQPHMKAFLESRMDYLERDIEVVQMTIDPETGCTTGDADPAAMNDRYVRAMNERDLDGVMALYATPSLAFWQPGQAVSGDEQRAIVAEAMRRHPRLSATVRDCSVVGDTAVLIVDWALTVPGTPEMTGRGFDVLRRTPAGGWRYVITNPFGAL